MSYEFILAEADRRVGTITLNRPEKLNALSHELRGEMFHALSEFEAANPAAKMSEADKAGHRELKQQLAQLEKAAKTGEDLGPTLDAVCWHDGDCWRGVVGTSDDGDVSGLEPLVNSVLS